MPPTILFVDGDVRNRSDWEAVLRNQGYKVVTAGTGRDALATCARLRPDLVILEEKLPDTDGPTLCRRLKADSPELRVPVVLVLPAGNRAISAGARESGADDFWGRPASRWDALSRIQSLLQFKSYVDQQAESVVLALARSIEAMDPLTQGHSERVRDYAFRLAAALQLSAEETAVLGVASLVHDIGKVAVPCSILLKPGKLTLQEMATVRQHPVVGESICSPMQAFRDVLPGIRHHHERMDGSGYPDGLAGEKIPLMARILQIVDIYDALTTNRPYRKALTHEQAVETLEDEVRKGWLDSALVVAFMAALDEAAPAFRHSMLADYYRARREPGNGGGL